MCKKSPLQMNLFKLLSLIFILVGLNKTQILAQSSLNTKKITIVIDPGHGGKDKGCTVDNYHEKDIALELALKIGDEIYAHSEKFNIIFTRTEDDFIPLGSRTHLANSLEADLFISIHANSYDSKKIKGSEVYVLGVNKNDDNHALAQRENASLLLGSEVSIEEYNKLYASPEGHILLSSITNNYLDKSIALASEINTSLSTVKGHKTLGVKQASFAVLRNANMPAVLFEAGYMTNKDDLAMLLNDDHVNMLSEKFAQALINYSTQFGEREVVNINQSISPETKQTRKPEAPKQAQLKMTQAIVDKYKQKESSPPRAQKINSKKVAPKGPAQSVQQKFSLQVATSPDKNLDLDLTALSSDKKVFISQEEGLRVYYIGYYDSLSSASTDRLKLIDSGYKGAFITKKVFDSKHAQSSSTKENKTYNLISY